MLVPETQRVDLTPWLGFDAEIDMLRMDLLHPILSCNKAAKLGPHIEHYLSGDYKSMVTFGGPYSNHVHAAAYLCKEEKIPLIAYIRGHGMITPTIMDCMEWGCKVKWLDKVSYRRRYDGDFHARLRRDHPSSYLIPEGGKGRLGISGLKSILNDVDLEPYDLIATSVGTGTTLAALAVSAPESDVLGFSSFADNQDILDDLSSWLNDRELKRCRIVNDYRWGGFGKCPPDLIAFCQLFEERTGVILDPIYTSKMLFGLVDMLKVASLDRHQRILAIHTGGLQGWRGIESKTLSSH